MIDFKDVEKPSDRARFRLPALKARHARLAASEIFGELPLRPFELSAQAFGAGHSRSIQNV